MNQSIQLKMKKLPKALGELAHSNQFLKMSALSAYFICALLSGLLFYQASKPLEVLTLEPSALAYQAAPKPKPEIEIERAVREYLKHRYNWEPRNVVTKVAEAQAFILPSTRKTFSTAMAAVIKFSSERMVAQRVYPDKIQIDIEKGAALINGDRITVIQGMKAAGDLKLELSFESGPRTAANPWGIYISKEKENP